MQTKLHYMGFTYLYRDSLEHSKLDAFIKKNIMKSEYTLKWKSDEGFYVLNNENSFKYLQDQVQGMNKLILEIEEKP